MQMKLRHLLPLCSMLALGCAAVPDANHTAVASIGRVVNRFDVSESSPKPMGAYQPGMGGALGGAMAAVLPRIDGKGAYLGYEVLDQERGVKIAFYTSSRFEIGQCVEVLTSQENVKVETFLKGEASIRSSARCK